MEKQFEESLIVGKFMPPHNGHLYLIDTALKHSKLVHLYVCYTDTEPIDGNERYKIIREAYPSWVSKGFLKIHKVNTSDMPQYESDCETLDEFYSHWIKLVNRISPDIDSVFTSEAYGDDFGRYLGVEHYLVDQNRYKHPISGTMVRENPLGYFKHLPDGTKELLRKRVAILGVESTGKSTLTAILAQHYRSYGLDCESQTEYGRDYVDRREDDYVLTKEDFEKIAYFHWGLSHQKEAPLVIVDTEAVVTHTFGQLYLGEDFQSDAIDGIIKDQKYDDYILLDIDVPWVDDGTREFPHRREEHFELLKNNLIKYGIEYQLVSGNYDERFEKSLKIIEKRLDT